MKNLLLMAFATVLALAALDASAQDSRMIAGPCPARLEAILKASGGKDSLELRQFLTFQGALDCTTALLLTQYSTPDI